MGAAPSSLPSSSSPPATIVLNLSDNNNNNIKLDDELDLEQTTSALTMADKIKALTTMRDKTYQKLGKVSAASSVNEESALLLERKIKRYDARIETLKDQEDRYYKEFELHRDDILQRNSQLNSHLFLFAILQGLLVVAASFVLACPIEDSESVAVRNTTLYYVLLILTALGMAVSLVTMLKMWDTHSQLDEIFLLWERQRSNEAISRTLPSHEHHSLNLHDCRRDLRPDLILPIVFLAGWFCVLWVSSSSSRVAMTVFSLH